MATVLERILGKRQQAEQERQTSYDELVVMVANDEAPAKGVDVQGILDRAGVDGEQFRADVQRRQQRVRDSQLVAREQEVITEQTNVDAEIKSIRATFETEKQKLVDQFQPDLDRLFHRQKNITNERSLIGQARQRLAASADQTIKERSAPLRREAQALRARLPELQSELDGLPAAIASVHESLEAAERRLTLAENQIALGRPAAGQSGSGVSTDDRDNELGFVNRFSAELGRLEQRQASLSEQLPAMRQRIAELTREADQIDAEVYTP